MGEGWRQAALGRRLGHHPFGLGERQQRFAFTDLVAGVAVESQGALECRHRF